MFKQKYDQTWKMLLQKFKQKNNLKFQATILDFKICLCNYQIVATMPHLTKGK